MIVIDNTLTEDRKNLMIDIAKETAFVEKLHASLDFTRSTNFNTIIPKLGDTLIYDATLTSFQRNDDSLFTILVRENIKIQQNNVTSHLALLLQNWLSL